MHTDAHIIYVIKISWFKCVYICNSCYRLVLLF